MYFKVKKSSNLTDIKFDKLSMKLLMSKISDFDKVHFDVFEKKVKKERVIAKLDYMVGMLNVDLKTLKTNCSDLSKSF